MTAKKILVSGPESSGKTTLCQFLLDQLPGAGLRPEVARAYLEKHGSAYQLEDVQRIWNQQVTLEKTLEKEFPIVICDTGHFVIGGWNAVIFKHPSLSIDQLWEDYPTQYDLIFLCQPDLPWEADPLRESPSLAARQALFDHYALEMKRRQLSYHLVSGSVIARYSGIDQVLNKAGF